MADDCAPSPWSYETTAVQTAIPRGLGETVGIPIHQAAAFQFATLEEAQSEFALGTGLSYARLQNPTVRALEERLTALEGVLDRLGAAHHRPFSRTRRNDHQSHSGRQSASHCHLARY